MGQPKGRVESVKWKIEVTQTAAAMLRDISDVRVRNTIIKAIDDLATSPELKGKSLWGELQGYYSIRAVGQRYRVVYRLDENVITVLVVAAGIRREGDKSDIYRLAQKLVTLGLTEPPGESGKD